MQPGSPASSLPLRTALPQLQLQQPKLLKIPRADCFMLAWETADTNLVPYTVDTRNPDLVKPHTLHAETLETNLNLLK